MLRHKGAWNSSFKKRYMTTDVGKNDSIPPTDTHRQADGLDSSGLNIHTTSLGYITKPLTSKAVTLQYVKDFFKLFDEAPIIVLTIKDTEADKSQYALDRESKVIAEKGDITKELSARLFLALMPEAILRRIPPHRGPRVSFDQKNYYIFKQIMNGIPDKEFEVDDQ